MASYLLGTHELLKQCYTSLRKDGRIGSSPSSIARPTTEGKMVLVDSKITIFVVVVILLSESALSITTTQQAILNSRHQRKSLDETL